MPFLEVKNLHASIENKKILDGINLELEKGKVYALMGPNGSGKSTLANILMGNPKYNSTGNIFLESEEISKFSSDEKARKGLFLSFQYPSEVAGVTISNFLRTAYNSIHENKLSLMEFQDLIEEKSKELNLDLEFLSRYLNEGFSGGEKKKLEILQLLVLNPRLVILDETDSGLDIDALKIISKGINNFISEDKCILIITHYKRILEYVKPDKIFVMCKGKIVKQGGEELILKIEEKGYN